MSVAYWSLWHNMIKTVEHRDKVSRNISLIHPVRTQTFVLHICYGYFAKKLNTYINVISEWDIILMDILPAYFVKLNFMSFKNT